MSTICNDFLTTVKESLDWLFEDEGFHVVHTASSLRNQCLIFLESNGFKIKIYGADDEINITLGERSAPNTWQESKSGKNHWYYLAGIVAFLRGDKKRKWRDQFDIPSPSPKGQLSEQTRMLRKYYVRLEKLFSGDDWERNKLEFEQHDREMKRIMRHEFEVLEKDLRGQSKRKG